MLRKFCFCPLAVLLIAIPFAAFAEDGPAPPTPAVPVEKSDKADKKDAPPDPIGENIDPAQVIGTPPSLPLKSDEFKDIVDGYGDQDEAMNIELQPLAEILIALRASSQDYLKEHINPAVTYVKMMNKPEEIRGEAGKVTGTLRMLVKKELVPNRSGITSYWKGQISVGAKQISTFISMEQPASDVQVGRAVNIVGIFMKRYCYVNNEPGDKVTWTPLLITRKVERATDFEQPAVTWMNHPIGIGIFVFVGAGMLFYFYTRMNSKARYANRFSRMKEDRNGPQGNFPRPG